MSHSKALPIYNGPADWRGPEIRHAKEWHIDLTDSHIQEIKSAVQYSVDRDVSIVDITPETFPLPHLDKILQRVYEDLLFGIGLVMFHGMPVQEMSRADIIRAYVGIGSWLGAAVPQNHKGHILGHVKDIGLDHTNPKHRIYGTAHRQPYHTDSSDIVGLICLKPAKSGGVFTVS
ncbi:MAG: TauD/TfdA family dioxygenase, partial [Sneathiella sp.]|nr:TauD/TfdA family dioxygenase [Sneathiella sp.]